MSCSFIKSSNVIAIFYIKEGYFSIDFINYNFGHVGHIDKINEYILSLKQGKVSVDFDPNKQIPPNTDFEFNCGYLFLQDLYYSLGLNKLCDSIKSKYKFEFDLNDVLSNLVYSRIIWPSSKLSTFVQSQKFLEKPKYDLQHIYRGLEYLSKEFKIIQKELFNRSNKIINRNYKVIYYDCTNFFFYTDENEFQKYGISKQHQPLPLVQMGLFMDSDGLPFAMNINSGNTSEQKTLIPTEKEFLEEYDLKGKNIIICTDAGLASDDNKLFNTKEHRGFIITQSIKKLKQKTKDWALDSSGWRILGNIKDIYNLDDIRSNEVLRKAHYETIFYKETEYETNKVKQALIITFSFKYEAYHKNIRNKQIERASKMIKDGATIEKKKNPNDCRRFIKAYHTTEDGVVANEVTYGIDQNVVKEESKYDGFYGITTNLNDDTSKVIKAMNGRWEIEESFRIMKEEFDSGTVHLSREDRIKSHFLTCFISLFIYRLLEKKLNNKYTVYQIVNCLRGMNLRELKGEGFIPAYTRTELTDDLHHVFGFNTDSEITDYKKIKKIFRQTKIK